MSRPEFEPPTSCTAGKQTSKELSRQLTHVTSLIRYKPLIWSSRQNHLKFSGLFFKNKVELDHLKPIFLSKKLCSCGFAKVLSLRKKLSLQIENPQRGPLLFAAHCTDSLFRNSLLLLTITLTLYNSFQVIVTLKLLFCRPHTAVAVSAGAAVWPVPAARHLLDRTRLGVQALRSRRGTPWVPEVHPIHVTNDLGYTTTHGGSQRDVVYLGWPIAPSYISDRLERDRIRVVRAGYHWLHGLNNYTDTKP